MFQIKTYLSVIICLTGILLSCKNESKPAGADQTGEAKTSNANADVSTIDVLDHDFKITPEGSRFFLKGFFIDKLIEGAITVNDGLLHIQNGIITKGTLTLDMNTVEMVANRDPAIEEYMRGEKSFDSKKYPTGRFTIEECSKVINDQHATHLLKGKIELHGKEKPFSMRARIDYKPGNVTITTEPLIIKGSEVGIKFAEPSQENIYFSISLDGRIL